MPDNLSDKFLKNNIAKEQFSAQLFAEQILEVGIIKLLKHGQNVITI